MRDFMVIFDNVSVNYQHEKVLMDFSMEIAAGEKIALSGISGSGKSTILNTIMGFTIPDAGRVSINNMPTDAQHIQQIRRLTAWLPQELTFDIKWCKTLVLFPFTFKHNKSLTPTDSELYETLEQLLLDPSILEKQTDEISGGQKQRLMLASILLLKKPILLLDEPTSALDAASTLALAKYVNSMKSSTVISASHDPLWNQEMQRIINLTPTK